MTDDKAERRAAALRANLRKRKAQARAIADGATDRPPLGGDQEPTR